MARPDLNSMIPSERAALANLILGYLNDQVVAAHTTITHSDIHIFTGHRAYIQGLEQHLSLNGGQRFVPLPAWDPAGAVPPEFQVMKAKQDGSPWIPSQPSLPAVANVNANAGRTKPARFNFSAICSTLDGDALGNDVNPWHGGVHGSVGGIFGQFAVASAVPLFWCWHAYVDDIYEDWLRCSRPYQRFSLQTGTALHETDATFQFGIADNRDVFAFKKSRTGTNSTEIHVLASATDYQQFALQTGSCLHETDATFDIALRPNRDVFAIKKSATGSNSTEIHILSAASQYQQFSLQTGTALHETDVTFAFAVADNGDVFAIKKSGTGSNSTEIHILSAASGYQQFSLQTGTALHETDATFEFAVGANRDLHAFKKSATGTQSTEVHVLSAASGYQQFSRQTGTALHETDATFTLGVARNDDVFAIKKSGTGSNSTEVHVLRA